MAQVGWGMFKRIFGKLAGLPGPTKKAPVPMWRQGDVFIIKIASLPSGSKHPQKPVLAEGEVTGHAHRLERAMDASVISVGGARYLEVTADEVTVVHEEHGPVTVPHGLYEIRIQREYHPQEIRHVVD